MERVECGPFRISARPETTRIDQGATMKNDTGVATFAVGLGLWLSILVLWLPHAQADPSGGIGPQIPAFLPVMTDVPMTEKLPIDGEWMVNTIRKRIRIEGGRAYAVDPWLHLFVLKVEPLMVVLKDLRRTGPGQYTGQDLPLMGKLTATLMSDGSLGVNVAGALGPAKYSLIPVRENGCRSSRPRARRRCRAKRLWWRWSRPCHSLWSPPGGRPR